MVERLPIPVDSRSFYRINIKAIRKIKRKYNSI